MDFVSYSRYPGFWQALPGKHLLPGVEEHLLMQLLSAVMGSWKPLQLSEERISNGPGPFVEEQMTAHWLLTEDVCGFIGLPLSTPEKCNLGAATSVNEQVNVVRFQESFFWKETIVLQVGTISQVIGVEGRG